MCASSPFADPACCRAQLACASPCREKLEAILKEVMDSATASNRLKFEALEKQVHETDAIVSDLKTLLERKEALITGVCPHPLRACFYSCS